MILESYNPLKDEMFQLIDDEGKVINEKDFPKIEKEEMLDLFKTMIKSRIIDTKALQYQRQGRMLTYAPNLGQEATQVGSISATSKSDWVAPAFRELGVWLHRDTPLYSIFLYWYGNELGSKTPEDVKILPVSIPIASQCQHATGLAYSIKFKKEDNVVITYLGDGGTSQGDFHEAMNFAAAKKLPVIFVIQNNQYAISVPRKKQSNSRTLAQKALAYDMPGILVDGNDIFAMRKITDEAVKRAKKGDGPTLIEAYTYRLGAHTTADDPTVYRDDEEVEKWKKKDPIDRMRKYLNREGLFSEEEEKQFRIEFEKYVGEEFKKVENSEEVKLEDVFKYTFRDMTKNLREQYEDRLEFTGVK